MMNDRLTGMVLGSFVGDSLALGAHWIYDVDEIEGTLGRVDRLLKPLPGSYHPTKEAGDFSHYGDQTLVLLESVAESGKFDLDHFASRWRKHFADYNGYFDHATKDTLKNFAAGAAPADAGSFSGDLSAAARIAPLAYRYRDDRESLVAAARSQTALTHNNPLILECTELLARIVHAVLQGATPASAVAQQLEGTAVTDVLAGAIRNGLESLSSPSSEAILGFGQNCRAPAALPSVVHLIGKHQNDLREALIENVMAGGDSAARGMAVGMILGAHLGEKAIPDEWLSGLKQRARIEALLEQIESALT
ncbi:MAG: ADP-ribosylglycohydrolase family protein [Syntrophobacteraceae bacterium]